MITCPNRNLKEWSDLVSVVGENRAYLLWHKYNGVVPESAYNQTYFAVSTEESRFKKAIGLKKEHFIDRLALINTKIKLYNKANGTSHSVKWERVGQSEQYKPILTISDTPVNRISQIDREITRLDGFLDSDRISNLKAEQNRLRNSYMMVSETSRNPKNTSKQDLELIKKLELTLKILGFKEGSVNDYITKTGVSPVGVADLLNKVYAVSKGDMQLEALAEETAHIFTSMLPEDHAAYKLLVTHIKGTAKFQEILDIYGVEYGFDDKKLIKEAVDQVLRDFITGNYKSEDLQKHYPETLIGKIRKVIDAILSMFRHYSPIQVQREVEAIYGKLASDITNQGTSELIMDKELHGTYWSLNPKSEQVLNSYLSQLVEIQSGLKRRLSRYKYLEGSEAERTKALEKILEETEQAEDQETFAKMVKYGLDTFSQVEDKLKDKKNINAKLINSAQSYISIYRHLDTIVADDIPDNIKELAQVLEKKRRSLELVINSVAREHLAKVMLDTSDNPEKDILTILALDEDMGFLEGTFGALANSKNPILANIAKYYKKEVYDKTRLMALEFNKKHDDLLAKVVTRLEEKGLKKNGELFDIFLDRKEDGQYSGYLVTKKSMAYKTVISKDPVLNEYFEFVKTTLGECYQIIPYKLRRSSRKIPVFQKNLLEEIRKSGITSIFKGLGPKFSEAFRYQGDIETNPAYLKAKAELDEKLASDELTIETYNEEFEKLTQSFNIEITDELGNTISFPPIYGIGRLEDKSQQSFDLGKAISAFYHTTATFKHKMETMDLIILAKNYIKEGQFKKLSAMGNVLKDADGNERVIPGVETRTYQRVEDWYNMVFLDRPYKDEGVFKGTTIDKQKVAGAVANYVSFNGLALNMMSGFANLTVGSALQIIESAGGEYYTTKEYYQAKKIYNTEMLSYLKNDNKLKLMEERFDYLQDQTELQRGRKTQAGWFKKRFNIKNLFYMFNKAGEHMMQSKVFIAMSLHKKVMTKEGQEISLWDAFEVKDGKLVQTVELSKDDAFKFDNRVKGVLQRIHGRYNQEDANALNQYALGRLAMQFRKWMASGFENRFGGQRPDERLGTIKGRYKSYSPYFKQFLKEVKAMNMKNIAKLMIASRSSEGLSSIDINNMRRNMFSHMFILSAYMLYAALEEMADDDDELKDARWFNFIRYQASRFTVETSFFGSGLITGEGMAVIRQPIPAMNTLQNMADLTSELVKYPITSAGIYGDEEDLYVKRGYFKGDSKLNKEMQKNFPIISQFIRIMELEDEQTFARGR